MIHILELLRSPRKFDILVSILLGISLYLYLMELSQPMLVAAVAFGMYCLPKPKLLLLSTFIVSSALVTNYFLASNSFSFGANGEYRVIDVTSFGPVIMISKQKVLVNTNGDFYIGDIIKVTGNIEAPVNGLNFDFVGYLKTQNISNVIKTTNVQLISESKDIRAKLLKHLLDAKSNYVKFAPLLVMGEKNDLSKQVYNIALRMNVVHLFVISGFHLSLVNTLVIKVSAKFKVSEKQSGLVSIALLAFYVYILSFSTSALRALLLIIFNYVNKNYLKGKYSSLTILNFVFILMFISRPWTIKSLSFIYTFVATYSVIIANSYKYKSDFAKFMIVSIVAYSSTLLISINTNEYFSPLGFLFGMSLSPLFVVYYVISLFLFPFKELLNYAYIPFDFLLKSYDSINFLIPVDFINTQMILYIYSTFASCFIISKKWNTYLELKN